jgi:lipopolysaccharide transport system permease protein
MSIITESLLYAWKSRRAWWFTATARTRERFARSTLGSFWLGISNLLSISVLAAVYGTVFKVQNFHEYVIYLGLGLVVWNTLASAVQSAPTLFKVNASNIKNTATHPIFYTFEEWSFQVQTFLQSFALVFLVLTLFKPILLLHLLQAGILPLLNLLLLLYWLPLIVCLLGSRYDDFFQLIPILLQLTFLLSPILYKREALGQFGWAADWNPLYKIIAAIRDALMNGDLMIWINLATVALNVAAVFASIWILGRQRRNLPFLV